VRREGIEPPNPLIKRLLRATLASAPNDFLLVYEIDLSEQHAQELEKALAPHVQAGRVLDAPGRGGRSRKARVDGEATPVDVRAWAEAQGIGVPKR
jgi:hypothetical protein